MIEFAREPEVDLLRDRPLRILFVAPYVPSPIRVRPYQILRHLVDAGHSVTLVALDDGLADASMRRELSALCESVHIIPVPKGSTALRCLLALPTPTPMWGAWGRVSEMARLLLELRVSERFDVAHVEHLRAAHVAPYLGELPMVFDAVDCITALQRQMYRQSGSAGARLLAWEEWTKLRRYEPRAYRAFDRVAVTSQFDARELKALGELPPIEVIPNGVDTRFFAPMDEITPTPGTLIFSGKMSYRANDDAARYFASRVLPKIRKTRPETTLIVAGSGPSAALSALSTPNSGITVTGFVDDLRPYLARAAVAVCPMRIGVGIQNKALEAMAMGRPAVCSPIAARAIPDAAASGAIMVADTDDTLASACVRWLDDSAAAASAGRRARRYVEDHHRWENVAQAFRQLYAQAMTGRSEGESRSGQRRSGASAG